MRRFLLFILAVMAFAACTNDSVEEQVAIRHEAPETITVGFEDEDTRIQLNEAQKTVWTKDDLVSVFYRSNANQKWQYQGETGERIAELTRVDAGEATATMNRVVVVYPYNDDYYINTETYNIQAFLPAVQTYLKDSYGLNGNIMISQSEYNQFSLKSVCGWLKLQLTGNGEKIKSITLKGNNGEQVAGELYINSADATVMLASEMGDADDNNAGSNLVFEDTILTEVTLDCGEGIELGTEATAFYIALPPQTFEKGFTVVIESDGYKPKTLSTEKRLTIERNHIQPMATMEFVPPVPNNQIWYTSSDGNVVTPYKTNVFGAKIISNEYNNGMGIITFNGDVTTIGNDAFYSCDSLTSVNIPDSVTTIGNGVFYYCDSLTSVNIPDSVTTIGNSAFRGCTSLTSVNIPDSVTTIESSAFRYCDSLTSVTIGDSVTSIGNYAFSGCDSLTSVNIPDSVTTLGNSAFYGCASLTSVTIGDSVTTIGGEAFYKCTSLTSVTIGDSVTTIGEDAFYECDSLTSVNIPDSVTTIGYRAFFNCRSLTSVNIPDSVTTIGNNVFEGCTSLTSVNIGDSVTTIGNDAFYGCTRLTSVIIGDSVTTIGACAFSYCYSLTSVTIPDSVTKIGYAAFGWCDSLTSVNIPDSVTTIGNDAFYSCDSLISVNIPDSVTTIGSSAFGWCTSLASVNIPDSVTTIGKGVFYSCISLTSVTIPDSVTTIGEGAFCYCASLTSVNIPDSVTKIGGWAFSHCTSLTSVYCKATTPPALDYTDVFDYNGSGRKIYVPAGSVEAYRSATYWSEYALAIVSYNF